MNPRYPIYIISKGRWARRQTVKTLEGLGVPYKIVIEPQEFDSYSEVIDPEHILVLPFSNLGQGSIPARNWVWDHSIANGYEFHWVLDDNLESVERFNNNRKVKCTSGTPFYVIEDFVNRYTNVDMAGMNYAIFCPARECRPPLILNTRIYSCILIRNSCEHRWRGKFNEDTDLSIRILKGGRCTVLFNAFLVGKRSTMTQKGGNTDEVYGDTDNRREFAESLQTQHPDVVTVTWRFKRWHHLVDYSGFKDNRLNLKPGLVIPDTTDNYGMQLKSKHIH